jgi:hypothetical protein
MYFYNLEILFNNKGINKGDHINLYNNLIVTWVRLYYMYTISLLNTISLVSILYQTIIFKY